MGLSVARGRRPGRFLLTGSANLLFLPKLGDSPAGRKTVLKLYPLTTAEMNRAPGGFLAAWLAGRLQPSLVTDRAIPEPSGLASCIVAGGFPEPRLRTPALARAWHRDDLRALLECDVQDVVRLKEPRGRSRLLTRLARRTGELLNLTTLGNELDPRRETVEHHLTVCERLSLIRRLQPWHRHEAKPLIPPQSAFARLPASPPLWRCLPSRIGSRWGAAAGHTHLGRRGQGHHPPSAADASGLRRLAAQCGDDFAGGILFHSGVNTFALGDPPFSAVAWSRLWEI
jgi:predicted AAA+ superfamily ATPase